MLRPSLRTVAPRALVALTLVLAAGMSLGPPGARAQASPGEGPGGPILVAVDPGDPFGRYYAEILRAEGLNEFGVADISTVTPAILGSANVVLLAQTRVTPAQAAMFSAYVGSGGNLIAMRPDKQLAPLLGLADSGGALGDAYLRIDTSRAPGAGPPAATMQSPPAAARSLPAGATPVATL